MKVNEGILDLRCAEKHFRCDNGKNDLLRMVKKMQRDYQKRILEEETREKLRLTNDDVEWIEVPCNIGGKFIAAHYVLLFTKTDTKNVYHGIKWTIIERKREEEGHPLTWLANAPVESYVLFRKTYSDMAGILKYKADATWYSDDECYDEEYSTLQDGIMDKGKYVDSYLTLEAAKEGALYRSSQLAGWGGIINKETLVHFDWSNIDWEKMREETRAVRLYKAKQKLFIAEHYKEICDAAKDPADDAAIKSLRTEAFKVGISMKEVRSCIYDVSERVFSGSTIAKLNIAVTSLENKKLRDCIKTEKTNTGYVVIDTVYVRVSGYYETIVVEAAEDGSVISWDGLEYVRAMSYDQSIETHLETIEKWKA